MADQDDRVQAIPSSRISPAEEAADGAQENASFCRLGF
jgi:hypothetical protein